jgi:hypothetical protein
MVYKKNFFGRIIPALFILIMGLQSCSDNLEMEHRGKQTTASDPSSSTQCQQRTGNPINPDSVRNYLKRNFLWGTYYNSDFIHSISFGLTFTDSTAHLTDFYGTKDGSWHIEQTLSSTIVRITFTFDVTPQTRTLALDIRQNPDGTLYFDFYLSQTGFFYFKGPFIKTTPEQSIANSGWSANQNPSYTGYEYFFGSETDSTFTLQLPQETLVGKYRYDVHSRNMVWVTLNNGGKLFLRKQQNDYGISTEDLFNTSTVSSKGIKHQGPL